MIRILNKKTDVVPADSVYVGRPSPLGNPFRIGEDGTREEVINAYSEWLDNELSRNGMGLVACSLRALKAQYNNTGKLNLICWCAPEACHADVIKKYIQPTVPNYHHTCEPRPSQGEEFAKMEKRVVPFGLLVEIARAALKYRGPANSQQRTADARSLDWLLAEFKKIDI